MNQSQISYYMVPIKNCKKIQIIKKIQWFFNVKLTIQITELEDGNLFTIYSVELDIRMLPYFAFSLIVNELHT